MKRSSPFWLLVLFVFLLGASWRIEKWLNWKFAYEPRVRSEFAQIKARLDRLEEWQQHPEKFLTNSSFMASEWDVPTNRFEAFPSSK